MGNVKRCEDCANRFRKNWWTGCVETCAIYETTENTVESARNCGKYEEEDEEEEYYTPSCSTGDYSPNNPWDAPGMSIKDFI